jgi:hypothetical protein
MDRSGETSSSRHHLPHAYAELGDAFPGSNLGNGGTVQQRLQTQPENRAEDKPQSKPRRPRSSRRSSQG